MDFALWSATNSHKSESLYVFATECTCSNHKSINISEFSLDFSTQNFNLVIVSGIQWLSVNWTFRKNLENFVVKPLLKGSVFTSVLHYFLGYNTSEERTLGHQRASRKLGRLSDQRII